MDSIEPACVFPTCETHADVSYGVTNKSVFAAAKGRDTTIPIDVSAHIYGLHTSLCQALAAFDL